MAENAKIDAKTVPVMLNGIRIGSVVISNGQSYTVASWPNMRAHFPAPWVHDGLGGAAATLNGVKLSVAPRPGGFDCALVGTVRGRHYDVRFGAGTLEEAGRHFREVVL